MLRVGNNADILALGVILHQRKILASGAFWNSVDADDVQVGVQVTPPPGFGMQQRITNFISHQTKYLNLRRIGNALFLGDINSIVNEIIKINIIKCTILPKRLIAYPVSFILSQFECKH